MRKYLFTILIVSLISSCVQLEHERFKLNDEGVKQAEPLEKALLHPDKGVHYVSIDTNSNELLVRFDASTVEKDYLVNLKNKLTKDGLLFVPKVDSVVVESDTVVVDSLVVPEVDSLSIEHGTIEGTGFEDDFEEIEEEIDVMVTDSVVADSFAH